jgi:KDO2-lipid IV(A) lauroyltransferase
MGFAVREILTALRKGELVGIAPDQSGPKEGPYVAFFGRCASTHQGPAVFSLRTGAALVLATCVRQNDGSYEIFFEEIPAEDLTGDSPENILELTRRHTQALERKIRSHPGQWLWLHRRWKHLHPVEAVYIPRERVAEAA